MNMIFYGLKENIDRVADLLVGKACAYKADHLFSSFGDIVFPDKMDELPLKILHHPGGFTVIPVHNRIFPEKTR